jgi:hypothetical protein
MLLLQDINHIVQELVNLGKDPKKIFESVLATGKSLKAMSDDGFYADVQKVQVTPTMTVYCFQLPCGGNIYLLNTPDEVVMVDTGFGIFHKSVMQMLTDYGFGDISRLRRIIITHGDADHAGAAGFFSGISKVLPEFIATLQGTLMGGLIFAGIGGVLGFGLVGYGILLMGLGKVSCVPIWCSQAI